MEHFFWDAIIISFLAIDLAIIVFLIRKAWYALATIGMLAFGIIFYGSFVEPQLIVVMEHTASLSETPTETIRIAFLADPHLGPYKGDLFLRRVVKQTLAESPDLVLLGGDYIYRDDRAVGDLSELKPLTEKMPVYAVMGNHDYHLYSAIAPVDSELGEKVITALQDAGVELLINSGVSLNGLFLAGIDDYWSRNVDLDTSLSTRPAPTVPTILLSHNPDIILDILPEHGIDLVLSGHTHGGQIRLPKIGPVGTIPTQLGQSYDQKLFREEFTDLFITSGLGESGPRARLFNPPEIVILEIHY